MVPNFLVSFQHVERSDTGGPVIPDNFQHSSGCSGKGVPPGGLWTLEGTAWVWIGGGRAQHLI